MTTSQDCNSQSTSWIDKQGHEEGIDTNLNRFRFGAASAQFAVCHQSLLPPADKLSFTSSAQLCLLLQTLQQSHQSFNQSLICQLINSSLLQSHICLFIPTCADPFLPSFVLSISQSFTICSFRGDTCIYGTCPIIAHFVGATRV